MWLRVAFALFAVSPAFAATPLNERVMVIYNGFSKESKAVAQHYMQQRQIPARNVCVLRPVEFKAAADSPVAYINFRELDRIVRDPVRNCLRHVGKEKILYLVLAFDTPFRLSDGPENAGAAIDSYLADIWDAVSTRSPEPNPYYAPTQNKANRYPAFVSLADYREQPGAKLIYSVWRLDGPSARIAEGLVDKAMTAESKGLSGIACFDRKHVGDISELEDSSYPAAEWDLHRAAEFSREAGFEVIEDAHAEEFGTPPAPARCDNAALYSGWYSLDHYNDAFTWATGAIGFHLDSASAANPRTGKNWSANALQRGITVTSGALSEPYLTGLPHPAGVFRNLLQGANVGDAFLRNTAELKWQIINVGDPLYRPFAKPRIGK